MSNTASPLRYTTAGLEFVIMVAMFACLGVWLDRKFDLMPLLTVSMSVFGFVGATYRLFKQAKKIGGKFSANAKSEKKDSSKDSLPSGDGLWNRKQ